MHYNPGALFWLIEQICVLYSCTEWHSVGAVLELQHSVTKPLYKPINALLDKVGLGGFGLSKILVFRHRQINAID